jgi:hypothetical protein
VPDAIAQFKEKIGDEVGSKTHIGIQEILVIAP